VVEKLTSLIAEAKRLDDPRKLSDVVPHARFMGISFEHSAGELLGRMVFSEKLIGNQFIQALHGGAIGALLESTAVFQLLWDSESILLPKTITITVDYLRPGRAVDTYAKGIVTKQGRRVVNVRVHAWQEDRDKPIASANAHFLVVQEG